MTIGFKVNRPEIFEVEEINSFLQLLILQGQVEPPTIEKVKSCLAICIAFLEDRPIGIGAIKQLYKVPFDKANVGELKNKYDYELGYIFIIDEEKLRGRGIAKRLCNLLLDCVSKENIFATTEESELNPMKFILQKLDFEKTGDTYLGEKTGKEIGLYLRERNKRIDQVFDDHLFQTIYSGLSHSDLENGLRRGEFQQLSEWKLRYGYRFNIYSNDHLIDGKKHFHFDNRAEKISARFDFDGNLLDKKGKEIPANILKELRYFVSRKYIRSVIDNMWNEQNPTLQHGK